MGTFTGVAWNILSTLVSFCFTSYLTASFKGIGTFVMVLLIINDSLCFTSKLSVSVNKMSSPLEHF